MHAESDVPGKEHEGLQDPRELLEKLKGCAANFPEFDLAWDGWFADFRGLLWSWGEAVRQRSHLAEGLLGAASFYESEDVEPLVRRLRDAMVAAVEILRERTRALRSAKKLRKPLLSRWPRRLCTALPAVDPDQELTEEYVLDLIEREATAICHRLIGQTPPPAGERRSPFGPVEGGQAVARKSVEGWLNEIGRVGRANGSSLIQWLRCVAKAIGVERSEPLENALRSAQEAHHSLRARLVDSEEAERWEAAVLVLAAYEQWAPRPGTRFGPGAQHGIPQLHKPS